MNKFKEGDVVELKSGGPEMTVKQVIGADKINAIIDIAYKNQGLKDGDVICTWFNGDKLEQAPFKATTIDVCEG